MTKPLPTDPNSHPIPVMGYRENGAHSATPAGDSKRIGPFAETTKVISIHLSAGMNFEQGGDDVSADMSDHYLPAGYRDLALNGRRYIAFFGTGTAHVSERE